MPDTTRTTQSDVIVESYQEVPRRVVYLNSINGERWAEIGECNQCGLCVDPNDPNVVWVDGAKLGEPGACAEKDYETRGLKVTRPEWEAQAKKLASELNVTGCSLTFEVIE